MCLNYFSPTENNWRYMDLTRQKFSCMLSSLSSSFSSTAELLGPLYGCSVQKLATTPLSLVYKFCGLSATFPARLFCVTVPAQERLV